MPISEQLQAEAEAFDRRMLDRIQHGHIPDLRRVEPCEWFYNNPWRHPKYVDMIFGEYFRFARRHLPPPGARLLEIGSGPGHMALEFARYGYHVTGIEISAASVEVAERLARENPYTESFGSVRYIRDDFLSWEPDQPFDAVCFFLTLHHFDNPAAVLDKIKRLLKPDGTIIVIEPARDWLTRREGALVALIRLLLSAADQWYEPLEIPADAATFGAYVDLCLSEYRTATDRGEGEQSPHDNATYATAMLDALRARFDEQEFQPSFSFLPRMVGGVRGPDEARTLRLADLLRLFDTFCVEHDLLKAGAFCFAGRARSG